jgi:hypothetical protein
MHARYKRKGRERMIDTLKGLGLSLLTVLAASSMTVANAPANQEGHFVTDLAHAEIKGFNSETDPIHFIKHGIGGEVGCTTSYKGTTTSQTVSSLVLTPTFSTCYTTGTENVLEVDTNLCSFRFTVAKGTTDNTEQTAHIDCPAGSVIEILHPNCIVRIPAQTITTGLTYTRKSEGKHFITLDANVQLATTIHGLCQFVQPTNGTATLKGSIRIRAFEPNKPLNDINLTAT